MAESLSCGDALIGVDERQRIVSWNDAATRLTGIAASDAVGQLCWDVIGGVDSSGAVVCHPGCSRARLARQGWPVPAGDVHVKANGGRRHVRMSTIAVGGAGMGTRCFHLLCDVSVSKEPNGSTRLTSRQREVLVALAAGEPAKTIARRLCIAESTVRNHIRMVLVELGAHSQLEAVAEARRRGLVA